MVEILLLLFFAGLVGVILYFIKKNEDDWGIFFPYIFNCINFFISYIVTSHHVYLKMLSPEKVELLEKRIRHLKFNHPNKDKFIKILESQVQRHKNP